MEYVYFFAALLIMAPFGISIFSGGRRDSKNAQPSPGGGQNSVGGMGSGQQLCEVSDHDHFLPPFSSTLSTISLRHSSLIPAPQN